jgi:hypothetical protein
MQDRVAQLLINPSLPRLVTGSVSENHQQHVSHVGVRIDSRVEISAFFRKRNDKQIRPRKDDHHCVPIDHLALTPNFAVSPAAPLAACEVSSVGANVVLNAQSSVFRDCANRGVDALFAFM